MLSNEEVAGYVWKTTKVQTEESIHRVCGVCVENVMKAAIARGTLDNITAVVVALSNFEVPMTVRNILNDFHPQADRQTPTPEHTKLQSIGSRVRKMQPAWERGAAGTNSNSRSVNLPTETGSEAEKMQMIYNQLLKRSNPTCRNNMLLNPSNTSYSYNATNIQDRGRASKSRPVVLPSICDSSLVPRHKATLSGDKRRFMLSNS
jgi:hypothetical protein